jgi:hypothetical protein
MSDIPPFDEFMSQLSRCTSCEHCGYESVLGLYVNCVCCGKYVTGREFRESTLDSLRVDYGAAVNLTDDNTATDPYYDDVASVLIASLESGDDGFGNTVVAEVHVPSQGDSPDDVMAEFSLLLKADGFVDGSNGDGTAKKYVRYMKMLFEHDVFKSRGNFFLPGARAKAHVAYRVIAQDKARAGGKTSARTLYKNYKNGFDRYVFLADEHAKRKPSETTEPNVELTEDDIVELFFA